MKNSIQILFKIISNLPQVENSTLFASARDFASKKHSDKNQRYNDLPYVNGHLDVLASVLLSFHKESQDEFYDHLHNKASISLNSILFNSVYLHDTLEDTDTSPEEIRKLFGNKVLDTVFRVTDKDGASREERHQKTYPGIRSSERATTVKLCDRIANMILSFGTRHAKKYIVEYPEFKRLIYKQDKSNAYLWKIAEIIYKDLVNYAFNKNYFDELELSDSEKDFLSALKIKKDIDLSTIADKRSPYSVMILQLVGAGFFKPMVRVYTNAEIAGYSNDFLDLDKLSFLRDLRPTDVHGNKIDTSDPSNIQIKFTRTGVVNL